MEKQFNRELFEFLDNSPTPFHATANLLKLFKDKGFKQLDEAKAWNLRPGKYCLTRNDSSFIAFNLGKDNLETNGFRMVGAHTDSPCLKVKPNADVVTQGYLKLGVEVYGGVLLNPWFDRDLSLAGRVSFEDKKSRLYSVLLDFKRAIAAIPSLAIHLDREVNKMRSINAQTDILPIVLQLEKNEKISFNDILIEQLKQQYPETKPAAIIDYEMSFYDTQASGIVGLRDEFIAASRLDNLLSCFVAAKALLASDYKQSSLVVCYDHEEVGSASTSGAQGNFLQSVLQRICTSQENLLRCVDQSFLISADNAHGIHPNYADKHDKNHGPILNQGPVIKINANQRYASNSITSAIFQKIADALEIPVQRFVVRSDMACGSTIGPITASEIGVKTIDIGLATFAMHSIRELAGSGDGFALNQIFKRFFETENLNITNKL